MTQLGREDRTVHHDSRSKSELSRDLSPSIQPASGSASENELGERPVREKLKKASLATISGQSAPPSLEQSKDGTSTSAPATAALVTASENGSAPKEENRGRPLKKRSFDDLDLAGTEGTALHEEGPDYINGHARKRSRDVRTDVRQRASDKPSVTSPLHEALEDGPTSKSALDPAISDVSLGSTGEMPDANIDYAPGRGIDDGGGNAKQTSNLSDNGSPETEEAAPQGVRRADADQEFGEGAASPRKKRSRDQLDTEHDREQKIAATEGLRAQRLSSELDRSEGSALAEKNAAPLEASDLGQRQDSEQSERSTEHSKSTFGNCSTHSAGGIPAKALLSSTASTQQSITPSAFASSGFAALANSSTSPFGIIGAAPTNNIGNTVAASANGVNASKASLRESKFSNPPTIGGFGSFATVSASGFGNIGPSAFAVAGSAKPGLFGGSVFGGGFSEGVGSSSKLANFAAPKGDANIGGTNGAIKPIGSPEEEGEEDGRDSDSEGGEAVGLKKDDIEAEVDERFQHQDVETGEDGEDSLFSARASLYSYRAAWKESGKGIFKFNVAAKSPGEDQGSARSGRFIMRAHQTFRVLLNAPVFRGMKVGDSKGNEPSGKSFAFAVIENGKPTPHMIKLGDPNESKALYHAVRKLQNEGPSDSELF